MDQLVGTNIGRYTLTGFITQTRLSVVYESTDTSSPDCTKLAIKLIIKNTNSYTQVANEININRTNSCIYIMPIIEIIEKVPPGFIIGIVMKNAIGRDLFQIILDYGPLSEDIVAQIAYAGLMSLKYLHENFIIHRDVKPDNFFLMDDSITELDIVLGDFGHAIRFQPGQKLQDYNIGTLIYNAPEIIAQQPYDQSIDIWSLGATLYCALSGSFAFPDPFEENNPDSEFLTKFSIMKGDYDIESGIWKHISPAAKDFVSSMLQVDPTKRPSIENLLRHQFIADNYVEYNKQRDRAEGKTAQVDESLNQADKFLGDDD